MRRLVVVAVALVLGWAGGPVLAQAPKEAAPAAAPFSAAKADAAKPDTPKAPEAKAKPAKAAAAAEPEPSEAKVGDVKAVEPKKAAKSPSAVKLEPNQKLCRSKQPDGAVKSWTCGKDQPCCVNHTLSLYTCGSQLLKCF